MPNLLIVMIGGAIGAGFRYHISKVALQNMGPAFPWGTFIVNLLGGLLIGLLAGGLARDGSEEPLRFFLGVGVLGGFTTFSAFSLETFNMINRGDVAMAAAYSVASVTGSVALVFIGFWLTRIGG
jgi:fluoride exporter